MTPNLFRGTSLIGSYGAMLVIGLLMSIYGPIVAVLQGRFEVSASTVGLALGTQSFAAIAGVLLAQQLLRARGNRTTLVTALVLISIGAVIIATAPAWSVLLAGTAVAGLGFGGVDSTVTQMILVGSGDKGPARANIAHAWFGIGTVAGPGIVAVVGADNYPWVFAGAAIVTVVSMFSVVRLEPRPTPAEATTQAGEHTPPRPALLGIVVAGFFLLYLTHFAVQSGIGNWGPTVLTTQSGLENTTATLVISGYWLMMVVGRFLAAWCTRRFTAATLVSICSFGLLVTVAGTMLPATAPAAYLLAGLFLGPIFPTGMAWMTVSGYNRGNNLAYVIAGSMVGMALAPTAVGTVIEAQGTDAAPAVFTAIASTVLLSSIGTAVVIRRASSVLPT